MNERVVKLVQKMDLTQAGLTAQEGFVLSRVDGDTTVELLCTITGLGEQATLVALDALEQKGVVIVESQRDNAEEGTGSTDSDSPSSSDPAQTGACSPVELDDVLLEALLDEDEQSGIDLKRALRARVRTIRSQLRSLTFFELLEVPVSADARAIRRAYFLRSKQFHPDRYYTKNLGPYKDMLAEIFRQLKGAYEFLLDDTKRQAYRGTIEQQRQDEDLSAQLAREAHAALEAAGLDDQVPGPERPLRAGFLADGASSGAGPAVDALHAPSTRARTRAVSSFMQRHLRDQFRVGRPKAQREVMSRPPRAAGRSSTADTAAITPEDHPARATRRDLDRIRQQRQRKKTFTAALSGRRDKAAGFFEQGTKQLEEGKALAAAASLKLAVSFDPENEEYKGHYERAAEAARAISAENYFKRALFEESVGRYETAGVYFQQAADAYPKEAYLIKAAESLLLTGDLIKSREYATKSVQVAPNSVDTRLALARVFLAAGQKKNARREADVAKKMDPGNPDVKEILKRIKRS